MLAVVYLGSRFRLTAPTQAQLDVSTHLVNEVAAVVLTATYLKG